VYKMNGAKVKQLSVLLAIVALGWALYQAFGTNRTEKAPSNVNQLYALQHRSSASSPDISAITKKPSASTTAVSNATLINPWAGPETSAITSDVSIADPDSLPNDVCAEMGGESVQELVLWPEELAGSCRAIKAKKSPPPTISQPPR
jgi:hypothetical protein